MDLKEKEHLYEFLLGLDNFFVSIKTQILRSQPIPSIRIAYHLISKDEQQNYISTSHYLVIESTKLWSHIHDDSAIFQSYFQDSPILDQSISL